MINLDPLYKGQDSIKFLTFMTPFVNELLEDTLVEQLEVDESFAERVVEGALGSKSNIKGEEFPIAIYRIKD